MAALVGGIIAVLLGIIGIIQWWSEFYQIIIGTLPAILILGGSLATYLGLEEVKDKQSSENLHEDKLKQEVEELKAEVTELKQEKTQEIRDEDE